MSDPVVSPADTIRAFISGAARDEDEWYVSQGDALAALDALLAVGERDKAALADAAVVLEVLAAQIGTRPYRELTTDFQRQILAATEAVRAALLKDGSALTSALERDRRQIARLTEAAEDLETEVNGALDSLTKEQALRIAVELELSELRAALQRIADYGFAEYVGDPLIRVRAFARAVLAGEKGVRS